MSIVFPGTNYSALKDYAVVANTTIVNTGASVIGARIALFPGSSITGFPPGINIGEDIGNAAAIAAQSQLTDLYTDINTLGAGTTIGDIGIDNSVPDLPTGLPIPSGIYIYRSATSIGVSGSLVLTGGPNDQFFFIAGGTITFEIGTEIFTQGGLKPENVFWVGGSIIVNSAALPAPTSIRGILVANVSITLGGESLVGAAFARSGQVTIDTQAITLPAYPEAPIPCYVKGTKILTSTGYVAIEDLNVGNEVVSMGNIRKYALINNDYAIQPIVWLNKFTLYNLTNKSRPICIKKNAMGENLPFEDLYVSPLHSIVISNKLLLAKDLVNGDTIIQDEKCDQVTYYHVELDKYSSILANGIEAESYLDDNNRKYFERSSSNKKVIDNLSLEGQLVY